MPSAEQPKPREGQSAAVAALIALVGAGTAAALIQDTKSDEGVVYRAYPDVGTVFTICSGTTTGVKAGDTATPDQCDAMTAADLTRAARTVLGCAPNLKGHANQLRAAVRFQNNTGKFCASSGGKLMKAGQYRQGCDALLAYNGIVSVGKPIKGALEVRRLKPDAKGRPRFFNVIRGLKNRRDHEHTICLRGSA
jgi:lysozyme